MKTFLVLLPALACLAMALVICVPMLIKHRKHETNPELAELNEEIARLRAQISSGDVEEVRASDA